VGGLIEVKAGNSIIEQGASDNDIYLILSGSFAIVVNGKKVAVRGPNDHVGEMAAIEPIQVRSAMVIAQKTQSFAKLLEPEFSELGRKYPEIWRRISK